ncbi:MAG: TetR/AcrR family transcriptional regulator [Dysgonamonadaceae bacterium]|jgi:AcrR family transcriptional regulator|nr:TetR/AcrR family transcriptional regulator [Dysgonamonadaceae bacterium]
MELKERIIEGASTLFFTHGIKSMTMSDIANELGISKRTLYEVFRDKEELLEMCISNHIDKANREIEKIIASSEDVIEIIMRIYAKHLLETQNINTSLIHDLKKYHLSIYKKTEANKQDDTKRFVPLFQKGIEQGLIRKDANIEIITWLLRSQFKALMEDNYIPVDKYSPNEVIRTIILTSIRGVATAAGIDKVDKITANMNEK